MSVLLSRRTIFIGLAAPAIVQIINIMPVKLLPVLGSSFDPWLDFLSKIYAGPVRKSDEQDFQFRRRLVEYLDQTSHVKWTMAQEERI
jgi:hypothetical protein